MKTGKKQESKRLTDVARKLVYLSGGKFSLGITLYAQAIELALKVVGAQSYSGNPRNFIKQNIDVLEAYVKAHSKEVTAIKAGRKEKRAEASKRKIENLTASGYVIVNQQTKPIHKKHSNVTIYTQHKPTIVAGVDVTTTAFLDTYEWRKLRMEALKKYGPKCMCCGATPQTGAVMNVDHIKPRKLWPSLALDISNLQILCHECNHGKGNWDQTDWRN